MTSVVRSTPNRNPEMTIPFFEVPPNSVFMDRVVCSWKENDARTFIARYLVENNIHMLIADCNIPKEEIGKKHLIDYSDKKWIKIITSYTPSQCEYYQSKLFSEFDVPFFKVEIYPFIATSNKTQALGKKRLSCSAKEFVPSKLSS